MDTAFAGVGRSNGIWVLVQLAYMYSMFESNSDFSNVLDLLRKRKGYSLVEFIYHVEKPNIPIDSVKKTAARDIKGTLFVFFMAIIVIVITQLQF
jgi:hypothetical protein